MPTYCCVGLTPLIKPATCVPCPYPSAADRAPLLRLTAIERFARSGCVTSRPLSITATPMPDPVSTWPSAFDQAVDAPVSIGYVVSKLPVLTCDWVGARGCGWGDEVPRRPPSTSDSRAVTGESSLDSNGSTPGLNET